VKFTRVHWFGKEFHTTVVTHKFAKITILLLQCDNSFVVFVSSDSTGGIGSSYMRTWYVSFAMRMRE